MRPWNTAEGRVRQWNGTQNNAAAVPSTKRSEQTTPHQQTRRSHHHHTRPDETSDTHRNLLNVGVPEHAHSGRTLRGCDLVHRLHVTLRCLFQVKHQHLACAFVDRDTRARHLDRKDEGRGAR